MTEFQPVYYFKLFFPDEAFDFIAEETNRYAMQYLDTTIDFPANSRFWVWCNTTSNEIKAFVALQIAMGLCKKHVVEDYWSKTWLTFTDFRKVMPRNKYELIQTFLHFNDLTKQVEKSKERYILLFKIQPLSGIINPPYEKVNQPRKCLSIDESMVKVKGCIFFLQYLPAKLGNLRI